VEHFLEFKRDWVREVDFGALCPESEIRPIIDLLRRDYPEVTASRACFHETEYALQYNRIS
jgi:hypothetical protein